MKTIVKNSRGTYLVSTVLLPYEVKLIDRLTDRADGSPYETMIFKCDSEGNVFNYGDELYCERYFTLHQAQEGHERAVKEWSEK